MSFEGNLDKNLFIYLQLKYLSEFTMLYFVHFIFIQHFKCTLSPIKLFCIGVDT